MPARLHCTGTGGGGKRRLQGGRGQGDGEEGGIPHDPTPALVVSAALVIH
jgi:hypothetical protein